ncbi:MAG: LicD family protein, partial [Enterococcus faecalis]|nr:LicD family protein [Enterococcus faecalis]
MQKLTLNEVQAKAVEILVYIDNICRSNNLHYT